MKKMVLFFSVFLTAGLAYSAGMSDENDVDICISNKSSKEIMVRFKVSADIEKYLRFGYTAFTRNKFGLNERVLKPGAVPFFLFSYAKNAWPPGKNTSVPEGEPEFRDLDICVQLRMIYEYFAVFDEGGQELLNLETIKSENFRNVPEEEFIKEWFGASYDESDYVDTTNWILVVE